MDLIEKIITVITPCHNSEKNLMDSWLSIKKQTIGLDHLVCIFVDAASTDSTWDMILQIEKEVPESVIALRLEENPGIGGTKNIALSYVDTPYVQFLNPGDCLCYNACEILYDYAKKHNADLIQFDHLYSDEIIETKLQESKFASLNIKSVADRKQFLGLGIMSCGHEDKFYSSSLIVKSEAHFSEETSSEGKTIQGQAVAELALEDTLFVYPLFFYAENILLLKESLYKVSRANLHSERMTVCNNVTQFYAWPTKQYELLQFMLKKDEIYPVYRDEINSYFLWNYYVRTILTAHQSPGILSFAYFQFMQKLCKMLDPEWALNAHNLSYGKNAMEVLASINFDISDQMKLDAFLKSDPVVALYKEMEEQKRIETNRLVEQARRKKSDKVLLNYKELPYVSIILTTYNRAAIVKDAIDSVLSQTYTNFELIIIDDCSTDATEKVIGSYTDERIRYIKNVKNLGAGGSRNVGIRASQYDLIAFEDDDDIWHKDKLEKQISLLSVCDKRVGMIYCEYERKEKGQTEGCIIPDRNLVQEFRSGYLFPFLFNRNVIGADTVLIRKVALEKVGLFREDLVCLEDWELFLRLSKEYYIILYPEVLLDVYVTQGSVTFKKLETQLGIIRAVQSSYKEEVELFHLTCK